MGKNYPMFYVPDISVPKVHKDQVIERRGLSKRLFSTSIFDYLGMGDIATAFALLLLVALHHVLSLWQSAGPARHRLLRRDSFHGGASKESKKTIPTCWQDERSPSSDTFRFFRVNFGAGMQ